MFSRNTQKTCLMILTLLAFSAFVFSGFSAIASAEEGNEYCPGGSDLSYEKFVEAKSAGLISFGIVTDLGTNSATVNLSNQTGCTIPMSLSVYKMFVNTGELNWLSTQQLFDNTGIINATPSTTYKVNLPSCKAQIDFWYGLAPITLLDSNPYGAPPPPVVVDYKITDGSLCSDIPTPPTSINFNVVASKIVCDSESDLPNWGLGGPDITANTANEFLDSHPSCHFELGWNFQWANDTTPDPGHTFVGEAAGWNTFGPTDGQGIATTTISLPSSVPYIWVREVLKDNYLPFTFTYPSTGNNNPVSAEIYCNVDVLNYDNYDRIDPPFVSGATYYCVAFNTLKSVEPGNTPPTITLIGANPLEVIANTSFIDPGATANDAEDGDLTSAIVPTGVVNTSVAGTYTITYSVIDLGGLSTTTTRNINVVPNPGQCIAGANMILNSGFEFPVVDNPPSNWTSVFVSTPGFSWTSNDTVYPRVEIQAGYTEYSVQWLPHTGVQYAEIDGGTSHDVSQVLNTIPGYSYSLSFWSTPRPNQTESVNIMDIFFNGSKLDTLTASGTEMTNWSQHTYTFTAATTLTRISFNQGQTTSVLVGMLLDDVSVVCDSGPLVNTPPVITLVGANPLNLTVGDTFSDPGATATDTEDGNLTDDIVVTGSVATSTAGTYTLTYVVKDSGNLYATTTRTVVVNPAVIPPVTPPVSTGGGGGGSGGIGGHRHDISNLITTEGEILGATSCSYLRDYLKIDWQNDKIEVLKLQSFLNVFEKENLSLTGVFDQTTFDAVSRFQTKYSEDILIPWGPKVTKGFVYILTKKKINEIYCNTIYPVTQAEQNEIDAFKSSGASVYDGIGQSTENSGQGQSQGISIENTNSEEEGIPVVNLVSSSSVGSYNDSVIRNAAVSLFALPQKIFSNWKYFLVFVVLLIVVVALVRFFRDSDDNQDDASGGPMYVEKTPESVEKEPSVESDESPVIILPGVLPDEEIVIENPEEEPEEIIEEKIS